MATGTLLRRAVDPIIRIRLIILAIIRMNQLHQLYRFDIISRKYIDLSYIEVPKLYPISLKEGKIRVFLGNRSDLSFVDNGL